MTTRPFTTFATLASVFIVLLCPASAWAYIDPNAGGMLFQLLAPLIAAVVGAWLFLRRWLADLFKRGWRRLTGRDPE
jgi:hypothetical protein